MLIVGIVNAARSKDEDKVTKLEGYPDFTDKFDMYSGYLPINDTSKILHYMFVTSQNDPTTDPLLIWFNGGPGCSSMLGFMQEHGPFVMNDNTTVFIENEYSWNTNASVLYIEQPAGVGFSYCDPSIPEDCTFDDMT
jgi:carboxypeptidase C (cathepsin A)